MSENSDFMQQPPFPWLTETWNRLVAAISGSRLPHAVLISGPGDVGETELAIVTVQYLLCTSPSASKSCGQCKACTLLLVGGHPDFHQVFPEDTGKAIKIDQIRQVTQVAATTAQQGGRKAILIAPAEQMNRNAANALLKVLEEPGANTFFFLVTSQAFRVLPTIRSRCMHISLAIPDHQLADRWLADQGIENQSVLLNQSGGRPLRVLRWQQAGVFKRREVLQGSVSRLVNQEIGEVEFARNLMGIDLVWVLDEVLMLLTNDLRQSASRGGSAGPHGPFTSWDVTAVHDLYRAVLQRKSDVLRGTNLNPDIFLADLAVEVVEAAKSAESGSFGMVSS